MTFTYIWLNHTIELFKNSAPILRDPSWDNTRFGKFLGDFGNWVDDAYGLWGWRKIPVPLIEIKDENMREFIHLRAHLLTNKIKGNGMYWVNSHKMPTSITMLVTEDLPLHPRKTTQIILTKLAGSETVYVANEINTLFFKNNNRFRYPYIEVKEAFPGSGRRSILFKWYDMNPEVLSFDVAIKLIFNYSPTIEKFQGFLDLPS